MSLADLTTIGKVLGLPGAMILVWYLLEKQRTDRNAKLELAKVAAENQKTQAMETGFRSIAAKIDEHSLADLESHGEQNERIARIESALNITKRQTPPRGIREVRRAQTQDGER